MKNTTIVIGSTIVTLPESDLRQMLAEYIGGEQTESVAADAAVGNIEVTAKQKRHDLYGKIFDGLGGVEAFCRTFGYVQFADAVLSAFGVDAGAQAAQKPTPPRIGGVWEGQGGVYAGDIMGDDGVLYGLVIAEPQDAGRAAWGGEPPAGLSDWDGLSNTNILRAGNHPAATLAAEYEADGHVDFYLPARREMLIAAANLPSLFGSESWYWTSSVHSGEYPWAVDFEYGYVGYLTRSNEYRVRPFRRVAV